MSTKTGLWAIAASLACVPPLFALPVAADDLSEQPAQVAQAVPSDPQAAARQAGAPVEDLSQRTPTTTVFANPDGSWTSHSALQPVRAKQADGSWTDIDLDLQRVGSGGYAPEASVGGLVISGGGGRTFASLDVDGERLRWEWPTVLPEPVVSGNTATFQGVGLDGTADLVVRPTASGFRHDVVLNERPTAPVELPIPIVNSDVRATEAADGALSVRTADGEELVSSAVPVMYEAGDTVDSVDAAAVETTVDNEGSGPVVTLTPSVSFLTDPETDYPVTIDPTWNSVNPDDTWVVNTDPNAIHPYDETLYVGTPDSGHTRYRTYLRFENGPWDGGVVSAATLRLRNFKSLTCNGSAVEVRRTIDHWKPGTVTWNDQPGTTLTGAVSSSVAKGYSDACAAGDVTWNVTSIVAAWAGSVANYGFRMTAVDGTLNSTYRRFRSAGYASTDRSLIPELSVTYNRYPGTPTALTVSPVSGPNVLSSTPVLSARVTDPDGGNVRASFRVLSGSTQVWSGYGTYVASGGSSTVTLPSELLYSGVPYTIRAYANDGALTSSASVETAATVTAPGIGGFEIAPCEDSCSDRPAIGTETPTFKMLVNDGGASDVTVTWTVAEAFSGTTVASGSTTVPSGSVAAWTVPPGLLESEQLYAWRALAKTAGGESISSWRQFGVVIQPVDSLGETTDPEVDPTDEEVIVGDLPPVVAPAGTVVSVSADTEDETRNALLRSRTGTDGSMDFYGRIGPEPAIGGQQIPWNRWAACGVTSSRYKVVRDYVRDWYHSRMEGTYMRLYCGRIDSVPGESRFGYRHIKDDHQHEFEKYSAMMGRQWGDLVGWEISWVAQDPDLVTNMNANRFCFQRKFVFRAMNDDIFRARMVVLTGRTGRRIITAFPNKASGTGYCSGKGTVIYDRANY